MKYRSLIIKSVVFIALLMVGDYLIGNVYRQLENKALEHSPNGMVTEYTMWKVNSDVVIIGASEARHSYVSSLIEQNIGLSVYNCGKESCRFYYQNAMINGILDRYSPKMIIWSITPDYLVTPSLKDKDILSQLNPFCKENEYCKQVLKTKSKYEPVKLKSNSYLFNSRLLPYLYKLLMPDYPMEGGYFPLEGSSRDLKIVDRHWNDRYDTTIKHVFENTINRCIMQGVDIVFVFTPRLDTGAYDDLVSYKELLSTITHYEIPLIDDLYHADTLMKSQLFWDNGHLNSDGALLFSTLLSKEISPYIYKD